MVTLGQDADERNVLTGQVRVKLKGADRGNWNWRESRAVVGWKQM